MRQRFFWKAATGDRWPGSSAGGQNLPPFNWVKIDNRGAGAVVVGLNAQVANDLMDYDVGVAAGTVRIFNVGPSNPGTAEEDRWPQELFILAVAATTLKIEIADYPLIDFVQAPKSSVY